MATNPSNPFSDILGQYDEDGRPIVGGPFTPMSETDPADVSPDEDPFADIAARYDEDGRPILGAQPPVAPEAAPEVDEDPTWQDYGRMVMSGGARVGQGVGWLMEKLGAEETGRALKERSAESARMWLENKMDVIGLDQEGLSENARRAMQTEFLGEGEFGDKWNKAKLAAASSLLGTMAGMGLGGVFTRGLATVGVGGRTGAAIGYGAGEAGIAAPAGGAATEEDVRSMTHDQLMGSLEYQAVYDGLKNMPEDERRQKARDLVADAAAGKAAALTAVSTFILSAPFSQTIERLAGGIPAPGGRIAGTAKGAAEEATQEFLQSGAEQMAQNIGVRTYADPTRGITEGALEEAVGGALAGGIMGAPAGFATAGGAEAPPAGPVDEITAEDVQGQIDRTRAARTAEMEEAQNAARRRAAALGGDALEQEVAAAEVGARQAGMLDDELAPLMQERDRRVALEEEGRIKTEEFTRRQEDARRLDEGFAKIEQKAQEVRTKAAEEEKTRLAEAKKAAEKQQRADIAENRLRRLRRKRQEKGLEPKEELPGTSPYPSEQVVEAFKGAKPKSMAMAQAFEKAAHEAATSPKNEIPEPTPAQIEAGNYKKGHVKLQGLDISIENPKGSVRSGVSQAGETWSAKMKDHYGYIRGTTSAEGETEKLDVFVGDDAQSDRVFVVDQLNQETGEFDEHKALVGYPNKMAALRAYRRNYEKGWKIGPITEMEVEEFKQWTKTGDMTRPLQKIARPSPRMPATAEQFEEVIQTKTRKEGRRPRVLFRLDEKTKTKVNQPGTTEQKAARGIAEKYFAPERIEEAEKQNSKSRERLVYMSPDDFLAMAEKLRFADTRKAKEVAVVIDELGERWDSLPFLSFENQGEIAKTKGHEGRHRAMDLKRRGVKIMPVRLVSSEGGPAPAIRWGEFIEGGGKLPTKMIGQSGNEIAFPVQQEEMAIQAKTGEAQPRTSDELAVAIRKEGGFTADPETGAPVTSGYAVGVGAEERLHGLAGGMVIDGYKRRKADLLSKPDHYLGGWFYEGSTYLDVSKIFPETPEGLEEAKALARKNREIGIMQLSKADTGEGYIEMEYTAEDLAEPVEGDTLEVTHYGKVPDLSRLKGRFYGTGIRGAEAQRLAGPEAADIRDRVYFYAGKHRREPGLGIHVYRWTQPNLYNLDADPMNFGAQIDPNLRGQDRQNQFDRLVKEAGYAGLYSPSMNGIGYVFGDADVAYTGTISDQTLFRKEADTVPETPDVVTVEEARAVADAVQDRLPLLKVEVVNNAGALPDELYALVAAENGFKAKGFFHPASGRVYLFSDNAESVQDVMKTILHEGVAHKGLGYLLGDQLEPVLRSVYEGADRVALEQIANRYGLDLENEADQLVAAEEHVAKVAESGVYSGLLDRIMSTVRNVLRNLGLIHAWTDSDIRWLLQAASGALKGRPLSKTTITEEVEVAETGEVVEIEEKADVALRRIQKRIGQAQKLRECLSA